MKKVLFAVIAVACMAFFPSCDNSDLDGDEQGGDASLVGTVWDGVNNANKACTFTFTSDKDAILECEGNSDEITYTYKKPIIKITSVPVEYSEGWMSSYSTDGKVEGNKMTLGDIAVFTKR